MIASTIFQILSCLILVLYLVIFLMSRQDKPPTPTVPRSVNVVVPTYNEADSIVDCLDSLVKMECPEISHSIYVLDDNSSDGTPEMVERYSGRVTLIERSSRASKADALNYAVENLQGDIFAVLDADCIAGRRWLADLVFPLCRESVGISTGSILVRNRCASLLARAQSCEMAFLCHQLMRPVERVGMLYSINGNNFAFSRSCWEEAGGFDSSKLTEDTDFAIKTRRAGLQIAFAPARVFTRVPASLGAFLRQRRRWYIGWYQDLSSGTLLAGAIFILLFYYALIFFLACFSVLSLVFLVIYYLEMGLTFRRAYGEVGLVNPMIFILLSPFLTTGVILSALPGVLKGRGGLRYDHYW